MYIHGNWKKRNVQACLYILPTKLAAVRCSLSTTKLDIEPGGPSVSPLWSRRSYMSFYTSGQWVLWWGMSYRSVWTRWECPQPGGRGLQGVGGVMGIDTTSQVVLLPDYMRMVAPPTTAQRGLTIWQSSPMGLILSMRVPTLSVFLMYYVKWHEYWSQLLFKASQVFFIGLIKIHLTMPKPLWG